MHSHLLHLLVYATLVSAFFALLMRQTTRQRVRLGVGLWLAMVGGALLLAFVMYPFPS